MNEQQAWGDFWAQDPRHKAAADAGESAGGGGCLPGQWGAIETAQKAVWHSFAKHIATGARVLDLATGDARALAWLGEVRSDLTLVGVDLADQLPPAPDGITTQGAVAMEALPFDDGFAGAIISQFGFEYGDIARTAAEIARVLAPGGQAGLMVHRGDGPILAHNQKRKAAIAWLLQEQCVLATLTNALTSPQGGAAIAAQVATALAVVGADRFGAKSPAWEIAEAMRRSIVAGEPHGEAAVLAALEDIAARAANEMGRIASLERACAAADDRAAIVAAFAANGLTLQATSEVREPSGRAFADFLHLA
jgi:SAM-dependent methyltransferase